MWVLRLFAAGVLFAAATVLPLYSQQTSTPDKAAVVTFTLDFPGSEPGHYLISIREDGHGSYESSAKAVDDTDDQLYESEFKVSDGTRARVFSWARQADFFNRAIDSDNRKLAFTGTKTLSYQDGERKYSATFNYSTIAAVEQLTTLFQGMSGTLEFGRMLTYDHRYQKLALDDELERMETQAKNHDLSEMQAIAAVLQGILDDPSVMNVARARAQRLLEMAKAEAAGKR
jgi:hypothetical protein